MFKVKLLSLMFKLVSLTIKEISYGNLLSVGVAQSHPRMQGFDFQLNGYLVLILLLKR